MKARASIIVQRNNQYLLTLEQRGVWLLPGGKIGQTEEPKAAAIRELKEETALHIEEIEYLFCYENPKNTHHVFKAKIADEANPVASQEIVEVDWFSWEEILQLKTSRATLKILHSHIESHTDFSGMFSFSNMWQQVDKLLHRLSSKTTPYM